MLSASGVNFRAKTYLAMSSSSTSKISVEPGGIPEMLWLPYARLGGQTSLALPPTLIFCTPSVQHGITRVSGKDAG